MTRLDHLSADLVHTLAGGHVRRIFGPPGTGKTTTLAKGVCATALARGKDSMVITSFTNTAAYAIADKAAEMAQGNASARVPRHTISTLHSFGYRAIRTDGVEVALEPRVLADWNAQAPLEWRITSDARKSSPDMAVETGMLGGSGDEDVQITHNGDRMLGALDMMRATLTPTADWPPALRTFADRWEAWKGASGAVDFGDMIHLALERALDGEAAPGNPEVFIVDEAQDLTPAEMALAMVWGATAGETVLAGDDDQAINEWRGGSARSLLSVGFDAQGDPRTDMTLDDRVLEQSYRIPSSVHAVAERWIARVQTRHPKVYNPRDEVGEIHLSARVLADPRLIDMVAADVEAGRSVMLLASCGYQLFPVINKLRSEGIPFHNPFRPAEVRWNPLRPAARGLSTAGRLYRYLVLGDLPPQVLQGQDGTAVEFPRTRFWTGEDIRAWMGMVSSRAAKLRRGSVEAIGLLPSDEVPYELLAPLWDVANRDPEKAEAARTSLERALEPDMDWLLGVVTKGYEEKLKYPAGVVRRYGAVALDTEPLVAVGTIHSMKGGGADVVYVSPDLSTAAAVQWHEGGAGRDQIIRQFYVAMTRAKRKCVVLNTSGGHAVPRRMLVPVDLEVRDAVA